MINKIVTESGSTFDFEQQGLVLMVRRTSHEVGPWRVFGGFLSVVEVGRGLMIRMIDSKGAEVIQFSGAVVRIDEEDEDDDMDVAAVPSA
jgi:hypothetical protein